MAEPPRVGQGRAAAVLVRPAGEADVADITALYGLHVRHGLATFEEVVPTIEEMAARRRAVLAAGLPYLVAVAGHEVVGYCYAGPYRSRSAYRFTIEDSVYVRADRGGEGIGRLLLAELLARCERGPWRQMVAVIGDSANTASIGLHRALGFEDAGTLRAVGLKFGRWVDSVLMQRPLGAGAHGIPERAPPPAP